MKYVIHKDFIEIKLGIGDRRLKKFYYVFFNTRNNKFNLTYDFLNMLYQEDPTILEKLGFKTDYENLTVKLRFVNKIDSSTIKFKYNEEIDLVINERFLVNSNKGVILFLNSEVYDAFSFILYNNSKIVEKINKLNQLKKKYNISYIAPKKIEIINKYNLKVNEESDGEVIDYTIFGIPKKESFVLSGSLVTNKKVYYIDESTKKDLLILEKYRDPKSKKIIINENNIEKFHEDYLHSFSDEFIEKLSDRIKFLTFQPSNILIRKNVSPISKEELFNYNIIHFHDLLNGGVENLELTPELKEKIENAKKENKNFVFYKGSWIRLDTLPEEVVEEIKTKSFEPHKEPKSKLFDLEIKENIEKLEYSKFKKEEKKQTQEEKLDLKYFEGKLKKFQEIGVKKVISAYLEGFRGFLLADDMGLGKTAQAIAFMTWLLEEKELFPVMIVVPNSLLENWRKELERFSPEIYKHFNTKDLVLINYEKLLRNEKLLIRDWNLIITDEAQRYKNYRSKTTRIIKGYKFKFHLALTGTPVENSIDELWNIIDAIVPGFLGKLKDFNDRYNIINSKPDSVQAEEKSLEILNNIDPIFLRRTKFDESVNINFPEKKEFKIDCFFTDIQEEIYLEKYQQNRFINGRKNFLGLVIKLLQVCDFAVEGFNSDFLKYSGKLKRLKEILLNIKNRKEKVLIFTKFLLTQKILKTFIESEIGMNCEILNGTLSREMQNQVINYFDRDLVDVLIINPRVGGVGLNLVKANHVIHFTPEWNPAVTSQATDRAYRIGQNKKVFVYYFYSKFKNSNKKTVEEYFMKLLDRKKQIKNILLDNIAINKEFENIKNELLN
jgi:SNF2 family DNA or RNA helicase